MPESNIKNSDAVIKISGQEISSEQMAKVISLQVDQHVHLPHMATLRLYDPDLSLIDGTTFDLTKELEITAVIGTTTTLLFKGEIVALEPEFMPGGICEHVVRAYDKSHRLYRKANSVVFLNIKDSDLASQFAQSAGLSSQVEATTIVYDHIYQDNQTDLAFLKQRAWRIGFECFVEEGKLYFRKPPTSATEVTLNWGEDLSSFLPRISLAEQVSEVIVRGWNPESMRAIVGQASTGVLYPATGESQTGAQRASVFGTGTQVFVNYPVFNQSEADAIAQARLDEYSGSFLEADGEAWNKPEVRAGKQVKLEGLGTRMSGSYLVTQAVHQYDQNGWRVQFRVMGTRAGLLAEQLQRDDPVRRWPGVVTAVVTNTDDPKTWGRIKVKYPWMTDDAESDWARIIGSGGGPTAGFCAIPDVNDEVVVAFEHGDINRPFILGGTWNGQHALPFPSDGTTSGERPLIRTWRSRTGHYIAMYDNDAKKIEVFTAGGHSAIVDDTNKAITIKTTGGHTVLMDDQNKKIEIKSTNGHKIILDDSGRKVTVESVGDVEVKSATNMTVSAGANMEIKSTGNMALKATGNLDIQANGIANIKTSAIMNIQGSLVKIN
jgi:phage protein D